MIKYIQILRFVAALWVAIFHGAMVGMFPGVPPFADILINFGYAGVDIFFIISGVIMAHSTMKSDHGPRAAGAFFLIRFSRIYTGWWPALLLYIIFFKITQQLGPQINLAASFTLYYTDLSGLINIAIWSLMFELYFYVILSIGLLFSRRNRHLIFSVIFVMLALTNVYLFINRSILYPDSEINWIQMFYIAPLVIEFFMGYFLYNYLRSNPGSSWKVWGMVSVFFISLIVYLMPHFSNHPYGLANPYYWSERAVLIGGAALAIIGMALTLPPPRSKTALMLVNFGDYSYSIYLLHILAFNMMLNLLPWGSFDDHIRVAIAVVTIVCLLVASAIYYHWIEHPIYMFFRSNVRRWIGGSSN